jgi:acetylornithine/LysW-gamma-L-lysine aminotransferase
VHPADEGYLRQVSELCHANGSLLIVDEVQTGFGRTGYLFAHQYDGIEPDILALGKSIGGGLPMGAVLLHPRFEALPPASHGSTFGGNPLACAAALATLDVLQTTDLIDTARDRGAQVLAHLREHLSPENVREVRGRGYMIGIELRGKVAPVLKDLQARGVLALPAGPNVLRLLPPLVISEADLWTVAQTVVDVLNAPMNG